MDIKTLLTKDSKELEKLSDVELLEFFSPYMKFIRPVKEEEKKIATNMSSRSNNIKYEAQKTMKMAEELLKKFGIKQKE